MRARTSVLADIERARARVNQLCIPSKANIFDNGHCENMPYERARAPTLHLHCGLLAKSTSYLLVKQLTSLLSNWPIHRLKFDHILKESESRK